MRLELEPNRVHSIRVRPWTGKPDEARVRLIEWLRDTPGFRWRPDDSDGVNIRRVHVPELRDDGTAVISWQWLGDAVELELDHGTLAVVEVYPSEDVATAPGPTTTTQPPVTPGIGERILDDLEQETMHAGGAVGDAAEAVGSFTTSAASGILTLMKWAAIVGAVAWVVSRKK